MSLINNVLNELEDRPSSFTPLDMSLPPPIESVERAHHLPRIMLFLLAVAAIAALLLYRDNILSLWSGSLQPEPMVSAKTTPLAAEPALPTPPGLEVDSPPVNRITGLQISETADAMQLEFRFAGPARSYLRRRSQGQYLFHIDDIEQAIAAPEIGNNPWLHAIQLQAVDGGVTVRFETREGVLVGTVQGGEPGLGRWLVRLRKEPQPVKMADPVVSESPNPVVTARTAPPAKASPAAMTPARGRADDADERAAPAPAMKLAIRPASGELSAAQRLQQAVGQIRAGRPDAAEKTLRGLLGGRQDRQARLQLIGLLQSAGRADERDAAIRAGLERYPGDIDFTLLRAGRLFEQRKYQRLVDNHGGVEGNLQMYSLLGAAHQRLEQHDRAIAVYTRALAQDPAQPRLWVSLGISQQHQQQPAAALRSYRMAQRSGLQGAALQDFVERRIAMLSR